MVLLLLLNILSASPPAWAGELDFLEKAGVVAKFSDVKGCGNPTSCVCMERSSPGTFIFSKSEDGKRVHLCYVNADSKVQELPVDVQDGKLRIDAKGDYLSLEDLKGRHMDILTSVWDPAVAMSAPLSVEEVEKVFRLQDKAVVQLDFVARDRCPEMKSLVPQTVPDCPTAEKSRNIEKMKAIAEGSYGKIAQVCMGQEKSRDCNWVEKEIEFREENDEKAYLREISILKLAGPTIAPDLKDSYFCKTGDGKVGKMILRKMDGNLRQLLLSHTMEDRDFVNLFSLVKRLHKKGIVHQDLHLQNILYRKDEKGKLEFFVTDFGLSHHYSSNNSQEKSPRVLNFRLGGGSGTLQQQARYDFESLISDLADKFGIQVSLETKTEIIRPISLPSRSRLNLRTLRENDRRSKKGSVDSDDNTVFVSLPGRGPYFAPVDKVLMSEETGKNLDLWHSKKLNIKLSDD